MGWGCAYFKRRFTTKRAYRLILIYTNYYTRIVFTKSYFFTVLSRAVLKRGFAAVVLAPAN